MPALTGGEGLGRGTMLQYLGHGLNQTRVVLIFVFSYFAPAAVALWYLRQRLRS